MIRALNEQDKRVLEVANRYVMSLAVTPGPVDWRTYHAAGAVQLMGYPRRKPKKDKK